MHHHVITDGSTTFTRVSKAYDRTHYQHEPIAICPVNLRPGFPWASHSLLDQGRAFEEQVRWFEWDNCTGADTGRYVAFYRTT